MSKTPTVKTPITDKNGKSTHVHKKVEQPVANKRSLPKIEKDSRVNERTDFTADQYNTLKDIIKKHLDGNFRSTILFDSEFIDGYITDKVRGDYWMSNGVHEIKLHGDGTQINPFFFTTRSANKEFLTSLDTAAEEIAEVFGHKVPAKLTPEKLTSSVTESGITFTLPDGEVVDVPTELTEQYPLATHITPLFQKSQGGSIRGVWAVADEDPSEYDFMDNNSFQTFRSEEARDAFIESKVSEGIPRENIFIVDKYDHGSAHYSVQNTKGYPDKEWDVAPSGVLVLNNEDTEPSAEAANAILDDYSNYVNGDIYGIAIAVFSENGEMVGEPDYMWGCVGSTETEATIAEDYF